MVTHSSILAWKTSWTEEPGGYSPRGSQSLTQLSTGTQHSHSLLRNAMLSHFSHVRLCSTPEMAAHQAPPSLGFSRQEHWSGLPFPSPVHESEK